MNGEISQRAGFLFKVDGCFCCPFPPRWAEVSWNRRPIDNRSQDSFRLKAAACSLEPVGGFSCLHTSSGQDFCSPPPPSFQPPPLLDKSLEEIPGRKHLGQTAMGIRDSRCTHGWRERTFRGSSQPGLHTPAGSCSGFLPGQGKFFPPLLSHVVCVKQPDAVLVV